MDKELFTPNFSSEETHPIAPYVLRRSFIGDIRLNAKKLEIVKILTGITKGSAKLNLTPLASELDEYSQVDCKLLQFPKGNHNNM
jgi:hypothetical protein